MERDWFRMLGKHLGSWRVAQEAWEAATVNSGSMLEAWPVAMAIDGQNLISRISEQLSERAEPAAQVGVDSEGARGSEILRCGG